RGRAGRVGPPSAAVGRPPGRHRRGEEGAGETARLTSLPSTPPRAYTVPGRGRVGPAPGLGGLEMRVSLLRALSRALLLVCAALPAGAAAQEERGGKRYLFCFWNVENFFDDRFDAWPREPDKSYDAWFAKDKEALPRKLALMSQVLLKMNGGRGPDIIAL